MRKLVLVSNKLFHYRYELYLIFKDKFAKLDLFFSIDLNVLEVYGSMFSSGDGIMNYLNNTKPDIIINFFHPSIKNYRQIIGDEKNKERIHFRNLIE